MFGINVFTKNIVGKENLIGRFKRNHGFFDTIQILFNFVLQFIYFYK